MLFADAKKKMTEDIVKKFRLMKTKKYFVIVPTTKTIKFLNNKSIVDGFTTNPSLMRVAGAKNYKKIFFKNPKNL